MEKIWHLITCIGFPRILNHALISEPELFLVDWPSLQSFSLFVFLKLCNCSMFAFWCFCFLSLAICCTDMLHTLSTIPRNLNFIEHTSDIGWKEYVAHLLPLIKEIVAYWKVLIGKQHICLQKFILLLEHREPDLLSLIQGCIAWRNQMYFGYQKKGVYLLRISFSQVSSLLAFVSANQSSV